MDDENGNLPFLLNTSIIVPIAIAGGVAFVIVILLYCCRHFLCHRRFFGNRVQSTGTRTGVYPTPTEQGGRRLGTQPQNRSRVSDNLAALQHQFLPWSARGGYYQRNAREQPAVPPSSTHNRANYSSTQVGTASWFHPCMQQYKCMGHFWLLCKGQTSSIQSCRIETRRVEVVYLCMIRSL